MTCLKCGKIVYCRGRCRRHYERWKYACQRDGIWEAVRKQREPVCSVRGCPNPHDAQGYCTKHYARWRLHGDPLAPSRKEPSVVEERDGCLHVSLGGAKGGISLVGLVDREHTEGRRFWTNEGGYVVFKQAGRSTHLARVLLGLTFGDPRQCDHIDGNKLDNRRQNLRVVTYEQNMQNKKPWGKSGHRNVHYDEKKALYRVIVTCRGKRHSGGRHKRLEDAIAAARALRDELFTHHNEDRAATL